jgi:hypothetical protein
MVDMAKKVTQLGEIVLDTTRGTYPPTASVTYRIDDMWDVEISRELNAPTSGPEYVSISPTPLDERKSTSLIDPPKGLGPRSVSVGLQLVDLRAVPIVAARRLLQDEWVKMLAREVLDDIPRDFVGQAAYAYLASAIITLQGMGEPNPVAVIARHCEPHTYNTWATRAKRAKSNGMLAETDGGVLAFTGKAAALTRK